MFSASHILNSDKEKANLVMKLISVFILIAVTKIDSLKHEWILFQKLYVYLGSLDKLDLV